LKQIFRYSQKLKLYHILN